MHKSILFLLALWFLTGCAGEIKISADSKFSGWQRIKRQNISLDSGIKVSGEYSICLKDDARMFKYVTLDSESIYELSFYVKGKNLSSAGGDGARILINGGKIWQRVSTDTVSGKPDAGTFEWKKGYGRIDTSRLGNRIRIYLSCSKEGTVWFDDVKLVKKSGVEKIGSFRRKYGNEIQNALLVPQGVFGFFEPGEKVPFKVLIKSRPGEYEYDIAVMDESGKNVEMIPRRKVDREFVLRGQPAGYYVVEGNFYSRGKKVYTVQSGFVSAPLISRRDPFFQMGFGVLSNMIGGIRRVGTGSISFKLSGWSNPGTIGKPERIWNWLYLNRVKPYLDAGGFEYSINLGTSLSRSLRSAQEQKEGWPLINDELLRQYLRFIDLVHEKLGGKVKKWTIQQETPSNATMEKFAGTWCEAMSNFVVLVKMGTRRIRHHQPDAEISIGGCNVRSTLKDIERITLADLVKEFDYYVIDAYTGNWNMRLGEPTLPEAELMRFYKEASDLVASLGKSPVIRNEELGYCINYGAPFDRGLAVRQAELTARQLILTKASPVSGFELHTPASIVKEDIKDDSNCMTTIWKPATLNGKNYHLPLPGGAMYITAASQLAFVHSPRLFHLESFYSSVFTRPDKKSLLILWNIEGDKELSLNLPVKAELINMYGRRKQFAPGAVTLSVGKAPVYLVLDYPAKKLAGYIRDVIQNKVPEFKGIGYLTGQDTAKVFIRNLTTGTRTGNLQGAGKITLLPDRVSSFQTKISSGKCRLTADNGRIYEFDIVQNGCFVERIKKSFVPDGSGSWLAGLTPGWLKYPDHIRPKAALQPELAYFKTSFNPNGHNVSAQYWTAYDDNNFYIAVKVDDPMHIQHFDVNELWRGDSLQIAFGTADIAPSELRSSAEKVDTSLNYGIGLLPNGAAVVKYIGKDRGVKSIPVNVTRKGGYTFYEAAFPFKELGGRPARFGFVIFDSNHAGKKSAPYWLEFAPGIAGGADPGKLKNIQYK